MGREASRHTSREAAAAHVPERLRALVDLAFDLSWTWDPEARRLFAQVDPDLWARSPENPWLILRTAPRERLAELAGDPGYVERLDAVAAARQRSLTAAGWFSAAHPEAAACTVAYFSAEVGVAECLPFYAGGLGVLAGDHLKSASALGVPLVGVSLLYRQGFFRQQISADGWQVERHPVTPVGVLPLTEARRPDATTLTVRVELPGRSVDLLVWEARIGRVTLLLLDADLPTNAAADRDITRQLYADGLEMRLQQEIALGIGGWRAVAAAGHRPQVLHLNEGHAAFAAFERARGHLQSTGCSYAEARMATVPGNIFTTHTPLPAAFDAFPSELMARYLSGYAAEVDLTLDELLAFGRTSAEHEADEGFNMAAFAVRHAGACNGVSRLHGRVSRALFRPCFPRIPDAEIPVRAVTNGVHVPSWVGAEMAGVLPTEREGPGAWDSGRPWAAVRQLPEGELWRARAAARAALVSYVRGRLRGQIAARGAPAHEVDEAGSALDPQALTLGFARRFTEYKRPGLLLRQPERLRRLLLDSARPLQVVVAGKAHPLDERGKRILQGVVGFSRGQDVRSRFVFVEDDDLDLMRHLVAGVDVWLNTPRRPMEACGTSGMKVLGNGGLNLSVPDGWWAEAAEPDVGWVIGDGSDAGDDADAEALYDLLEREVVPAFYERGADGLPHAWLAKVRNSMAALTPRFSSHRMVREYAADYYVPALARMEKRGGAAPGALAAWERVLRGGWERIAFGRVSVERAGGRWVFRAEVRMPDIPPEFVQAQIYADGRDGGAPLVTAMRGDSAAPPGRGRFRGEVPADRPAEDHTVRVVPFHPLAEWPITLPLVAWAH